MPYRHISVMPAEVAAYLNCRPGKIYVDGTLGGSGHAQAICSQIAPGGLFIGIDRDRDAILNAEKVLSMYGPSIRLFQDNYKNLAHILSSLRIPAVDGILLDLGLSLHQLEASGRGFSFKRDEPLDMRMNREDPLRAEDLVNTLEPAALKDLLRRYGEERWAGRIAGRIVDARKQSRIRSSLQLAEIVRRAIPKKAAYSQRIHPATRVFMALRIAVNRELEALETFLEGVVDWLNPGGRLCVLAFHSLEDRMVKQRFRQLQAGCTCPPGLPQCVCGNVPAIRVLTRKALRPGAEEIERNPMARSVRLRAFEKLK